MGENPRNSQLCILYCPPIYSIKAAVYGTATQSAMLILRATSSETGGAGFNAAPRSRCLVQLESPGIGTQTARFKSLNLSNV